MNLQAALRTCIVASLISGIVFIALNVLRLLGIFNIVHAFLIFNMLTLAGIAAIGVWHWRKLALRPLEWLLFACLLITSLTSDYADRTVANIVIDIARPVLFVLAVATLRSMLDVQAFITSIMVRRLLATTVWVTLLAVPFCYAISTMVQTIYPAYSSIDSVLGLGWLMAVSPFACSVLFLMVLFVSGKRMVYLVGLLLLVILCRTQKKRLGWIAASIAVGLLISPFLMPANESFIMKAPAMNYLSRSQAQEYIRQHPGEVTAERLAAASSIFSKVLNVATGGRVDEMQDANASITNLWTYVLGKGPGYEYHSQAFEEDGKKHRNLHFTPLSLAIYYGIIFLGVFAAYVGAAILPAWRLLTGRSQPVLFSYSVYFLGSLPFCLTEYSIFAYSNFAIACGLVVASAGKNYAVREPVASTRYTG